MELIHLDQLSGSGQTQLRRRRPIPGTPLAWVGPAAFNQPEIAGQHPLPRRAMPVFIRIQLPHVSCGVPPTGSEGRKSSSASCRPSKLLEGLRADATCGSLPEAHCSCQTHSNRARLPP